MITVAINDEILKRLDQLDNKTPPEKKIEEILLEGIAWQENKKKLLHDIKSIAAMTPPGVQQTDSVELLRQDRDS
jgi:hypothetical protein